MKYIISLYLAIFITASHAITVPATNPDPAATNSTLERTIAVVDKLNLISNEVAICQGYYAYREDAEGTLRFALHGEFMIDLALEFFNDSGIEVVGDDPSDIYYKNVERARSQMSNMSDDNLTQLGEECVRLNTHIENAKDI